MKRKLLLFLLFVTSIQMLSQNPLWTEIKKDNFSSFEKIDRNTLLKEHQLYALNVSQFKATLSSAPSREMTSNSPGILLPFPTADGKIENFRVYENSIMHPDLASRYQDIKSYVGFSIDSPGNIMYFSTTIFGLHAMKLSGNDTPSYIDPYTKDLTTYVVYSKNNVENTGKPFECQTQRLLSESTDTSNETNSTQAGNGILRTYRLAISSTVEYSAYHINQAGLNSGTLDQKREAVLAAMVVTMVRVNGVYEIDLSVHMELIPNNDILICITSDGFANNSGGTLLGQNQAFIDSNIGTANYDIGHIFSTGGGGVAYLGSVCTSDKAHGVTGSGNPINDPFNIDYVAHEMGHQFGANHTFSTDTGSCQGNKNSPTAVEPGSGTTIMAYAGICSPNDVQNNSDAHFSYISIQEINAFLMGDGGTCSVNSVLQNSAPVIGNLQNYTIPKGTQFVLTGVATDAENDPLTYCWEQSNNENSTQPPLSTSTNGPNFRSRPPSASPERYFPALNATSLNYEVIPTVARTLNFALTVRDNSPNGPLTARGNMVVTVANIGPFTVTSPNTSVTWPAGSNQTVTWDVAGTTANGINTQYVDIYMSSNSGNSYPVLLASKVPNDGSETITVPNTPGTANKIMVRANGNIFYDVSNSNFTISAATSTFSVSYNGVANEQNKGVCIGGSATYTLNYVPLNGFSGTTTFSATGIPAGSSITFSPAQISSAGTVTATVNTTGSSATGFFPFTVNATSGSTTKSVNYYFTALNSSFGSQNLTSPANGATGLATTVPFSWPANSASTTFYQLDVATDQAFTNNIGSITTASTSYNFSGLANGTHYYWRVTPKNDGCGGNPSAARMFKTGFCGDYVSTDVPLSISASGTPTINSTLVIPATENIAINDLTVSLNITHARILNLNVKLVSPQGTEVALFSNACGIQLGFQNAVATFDDLGTTLTCSTSPPAVSGTLKPSQQLSAFDGQNSQGTWTLKIFDNANNYGGSLNSWSLKICSQEAPMSVGDENPNAGFTVFPNPNNGSFKVVSDKIKSDKVGIQVYDLRGRMIFDKNYNTTGRLDQSIDLQNVQTGVYLLFVSDGENREAKRIIVK